MSDLPKHQLLLKLLRMTESDNDNEATIGIRKANALLREAGWDWEKLLTGKIKVVGDPWANIPAPPRREPEPANTWQAPPKRQAPRPQPQTRAYTDLNGGTWVTDFDRNAANDRIRRANAAASQPQDFSYMAPQPAPTYSRPTPPVATIGSTRSNGYSGNCYCCGTFCGAGSAYIFKPASKWEIACDPCNKSSAPIPTRAAKPRTTASSVFNHL